MLTERMVFGSIEILEDGQIQLREDTVIERDGAELSRLYHRRVVEPDMPLDSLPAGRVRDVAAVVWTQAVVDEYIRKKQERQSEESIQTGR